MADRELIRHRHHMLTHHLTRLDLALQRVQGSLITTHIGDFAVEMRRDREAKALERKAGKEKGISDFLGYSLTYLLRLGRVAAQENPPPRAEGTRNCSKASTSDDASEGP